MGRVAPPSRGSEQRQPAGASPAVGCHGIDLGNRGLGEKKGTGSLTGGRELVSLPLSLCPRSPWRVPSWPSCRPWSTRRGNRHSPNDMSAEPRAYPRLTAKEANSYTE